MQSHSRVSPRKSVLKQFLQQRGHADSVTFVTDKEHQQVHDRHKKSITEWSLLCFIFPGCFLISSQELRLRFFSSVLANPPPALGSYLERRMWNDAYIPESYGFIQPPWVGLRDNGKHHLSYSTAWGARSHPPPLPQTKPEMTHWGWSVDWNVHWSEEMASPVILWPHTGSSAHTTEVHLGASEIPWFFHSHTLGK